MQSKLSPGKIRIAFVMAFGGMILAGAGVTTPWQKDFAAWTEKDAQAVVHASPWAKQMAMPISGRPDVVEIESADGGTAAPTAGLGNAANTNAGATQTHNDGGQPRTSNIKQSGVSSSTGAPELQPVVTVLWSSAAPVRLALLKLRTGAEAPTSEQVANALKARPNYTLAVSGLPAPEKGFDPKSLAGSAFLAVHGKPPVVSTESTYRKIGNSDVYFFHFPRATLEIAPSDQQVEFRMKMGKTQIKKKFDLAAMQYKGELSL